MKKKIKLNTPEQIKNFVHLTQKMECDVLITSGKYSVDAKSLLGIYSLSLSEPVVVELIERDYHEKDAFLSGLIELGIIVE